MKPRPAVVPTFQQVTDKLAAWLHLALIGPTLTYAQVSQINEQGLYLVFKGKVLVYVGKTGRSGKLRVREMAADFRSHTLNRKLLSERLRDQGMVFSTLTSSMKQQWIKNALLTEAVFRQHQAAINEMIRTEMTFKFLPVAEPKDLGQLEHFGIAVLEPVYND